MKNFIVGALIIGLSIIVGFAFFGGKTVIEQYGASVGPEHYNQEYFYGGLIQGGGIVTKTAGATVTWTANDVCIYDVIKWAPTATTSTTTIPTAASIISKCLPKNGDFKDITYWNTSPAASTTIFTMGAGVTSYVGTGANQVIEGLNIAAIRFVRASSTAVFMFIDEGVVQ